MPRPRARARLLVAAGAIVMLVASAPAAIVLAGGDRPVPVAGVTPAAASASAATSRPLAAVSRVAPDAPPAGPSVAPHVMAALPSAPPAPRASSGSGARDSSSDSHRSPAYRGTNHVWIPSLGISRSIVFYPCSRSQPPGLAVYRWGCAGANNVYLFAHAYAAFKPLHDAYVSGRLRKGMKVVYADGGGRVRTFAVAWWRVTTPDQGEFAYAAQSRPSLTLQTCLGARSQYRLIVRLTQVG